MSDTQLVLLPIPLISLEASWHVKESRERKSSLNGLRPLARLKNDVLGLLLQIVLSPPIVEFHLRRVV